jgi:predicted nuclease of predicted toxin-antitoxin system
MIWLDAHLSPRVARWIRESLGHDARALREIGLRDAEDQVIFDRGKKDDVIILTKDKDFVDLAVRLGSPPAVIWLRNRVPVRCTLPNRVSAPAAATHWERISGTSLVQ